MVFHNERQEKTVGGEQCFVLVRARKFIVPGEEIVSSLTTKRAMSDSL